jgi:hypothetical protein
MLLEDDHSMFHVYCPHCLELVQMEEATGDSSNRCPRCAEVLDAAVVTKTTEYEVHTPLEKSRQSAEVQEYVQSLEKEARKEQQRQPYHRKRFPVDLIVGLILIGGGMLVFVNVFRGEGGLMSSLINGIFPALLLVLIGAVCLRFWAD